MRGSIQEMQNFDAHKVVNMLWVLTKKGTPLPDSLRFFCAAAPKRMQEFNAQDLVNPLWAMAKTLPDVSGPRKYPRGCGI